MARLNHAKHAHRGRPTERSDAAFYGSRPNVLFGTGQAKAKASWHPNQSAKGGPVRRLSADEIARIAAERGYTLAS